jgi:hypothetical protein
MSDDQSLLVMADPQFASVDALLRLVTDAAACGQRLVDLKAKAAAAAEAKVDAQLAQNVLDEKASALTQREAAVEERERQIKIREFTFAQRHEEAVGQLRSSYLALVQSDSAMKTRIMNFSGMLAGFDVGIRELPNWPALERMLGIVDVIPEMRDPPAELTREGFGGDKFSDQSTLTRAAPSTMDEADQLPLLSRPADPSGRARRRSRLLSGGMITP